MSTNIKCRALHIINSAISRFWVQPLEDRIVPLLEKKPGRIPNYLYRLASWWANAGRIIVNELHPFKIRWVSPEWSVTYLGNGETAEFLSSLLFPTQPEEVECRRIRLWQVPAHIRKQAREGDLVVCELNQILHFSPAKLSLSFTSPRFIDQVIENFDRPMDEILASFYKDVRRRIHQLEAQGFSYEATHSKADFDLFYYQMYLPYIKGRHAGRSAMINDYDLMFHYFKEGVLILVKLDGEPIAGGVLKLQGDLCMGLQMGVLDGKFERVKQGSNVALWWYGMLWAHQHGIRNFEVGISFPLTSNGVFNFKRHWGTQVWRDKFNHTSWSFLAKDLSDGLRDHLNQLGFIIELKGEHYQIQLPDPVNPPENEILANQLYHLAKCGIAGIILISSEGKWQLIPADALRQDLIGRRYLAVTNFAVQ